MTSKVVNVRMQISRNDKQTCHNDNEMSHPENTIEELLRKRKKGAFEMALENRLKEYRTRLGINQADMGKLAGVSRQTISLIERGDYSPSVTLALKLAKICQVTVEDIFTYTEDGEDE